MTGRGALSAVRHIRRMSGGTQPQLIHASDGKLYVAKFKNNPRHIRVLANEFMATRLGLWLGLPMPQAGMIEVSEWLIAHSPELSIEIGETVVPCSTGLQFASPHVGGFEQNSVLNSIPANMLDVVVNRLDLVRVLAFDKWVGNCDGRQAIFAKRGTYGPYDMTFIDQGYCFNAGQWTFPDLPLLGTYERDYVYGDVVGWESFEPVLSRIEEIDCTVLWKIAIEVPQEWYQYDADGLSRLVEALYKRRMRVCELIASFRSFNPASFPNWCSSINRSTERRPCRNRSHAAGF